MGRHKIRGNTETVFVKAPRVGTRSRSSAGTPTRSGLDAVCGARAVFLAPAGSKYARHAFHMLVARACSTMRGPNQMCGVICVIVLLGAGVGGWTHTTGARAMCYVRALINARVQLHIAAQHLQFGYACPRLSDGHRPLRVATRAGKASMGWWARRIGVCCLKTHTGATPGSCGLVAVPPEFVGTHPRVGVPFLWWWHRACAHMALHARGLLCGYV